MALLLAALLAQGSSPWPKPHVFTSGSDVIRVPAHAAHHKAEFKFTLPKDLPHGSALGQAAARTARTLMGSAGEGCTPDNATTTAVNSSVWLSSCDVTVSSPLTPLAKGVDEGYKLSISAAARCSISAKTQWGAIHALETLTQLAGENCTIVNAPIAIDDAPRFKFRGLMIDSSRHFLPVLFIKHIIDGMSANKLNVLHWHIVDSNSFPYVSTLFPGLSGKGAYSHKAVYTPADMKGLVDYARTRGVRIMPEFDMPGHGDWEQGEPTIMVTDGPCKNTMNPTVPALYTFLAKFLKEVTTIFPDEYLFLGGDEVDGECWSGSPSVQAWMTKRDMNASGLGRYFWQQMTKEVLPKLDRTLGVWEDDSPQPHPDDLPAGSFGNIWQAQSTIVNTTERKFDAVLSGPWYLDQQKPGGCSSYSLEGMWKCFYDVEPLKGLSSEDAKYVLGGQACQWSEGISEHNFDARTFTNLAAVAERLWSPRASTSGGGTSARLVEHICRMNTLGFGANPIEPSFCETADLDIPRGGFPGLAAHAAEL